MKILHVTPAYEPAWKTGGVVRAISLLCRGLVSLGHKVTVYTTNTDGTNYLSVPVNQPVDVGGVEVWYFHTPMPRFFRYSRELAKACRNSISRFDIVHIASFWNYPAIPAAKECKKRRIPYVVSTHGTLIDDAVNRKKLRKLIYLKLFDNRNITGASAIHFTAKLERKTTTLFYPNGVPSFIVPNGLDLEEFASLPNKSHSFNGEFGLPPQNKVIAYLGRLDPRKGLDVLIISLSEVAKRFPMLSLLVVGPDSYEYKSHLEDIVRREGLNNIVKFVGFLEPSKRNFLFSNTDILILPAWEGENFGYAAVEAMATGIPVLVSENVGICDAVREDGAGLVVSVNEDVIANALIEMLSNPERLKEMGKAAYESARKRYDIKVVAKLMAKAYEDILTGRRSPECSWEG